MKSVFSELSIRVLLLGIYYQDAFPVHEILSSGRMKWARSIIQYFSSLF